MYKLQLDNVEERAKFDDTIGQEWKEKYPENKYDANGMNLLHYCIWNCHCSTVKKLATSGYGNETCVYMFKMQTQKLE